MEEMSNNGFGKKRKENWDLSLALYCRICLFALLLFLSQFFCLKGASHSEIWVVRTVENGIWCDAWTRLDVQLICGWGLTAWMDRMESHLSMGG